MNHPQSQKLVLSFGHCKAEMKTGVALVHEFVLLVLNEAKKN